jgi:hypothetical protein
MRHQGSRHPATDDGHARVVVTRQDRILPLGTAGVPEPHRLADSQGLLSTGHRRCTKAGSASHARSRSSGQQFTILSAGILARRACANAVSAYESCAVVWASLSSEEALRFKSAGRQRVIKVLSRGIAIDLNRDAALSGRSQPNTVSQLAMIPAAIR